MHLAVEHFNEEGLMLNQVAVASRIIEIVKAHPGCGLDELTSFLPDLSWSQVFVEVDQLNRLGQLRLTKTGSQFLVKLHAL